MIGAALLAAALQAAPGPGISPPLDCVVLLHGLARTSRAMDDMAAALQGDGYRVANVSYPSREYPIEELAPMAIEAGLDECGAGVTKVHGFPLPQNDEERHWPPAFRLRRNESPE